MWRTTSIWCVLKAMRDRGINFNDLFWNSGRWKFVGYFTQWKTRKEAKVNVLEGQGIGWKIKKHHRNMAGKVTQKHRGNLKSETRIFTTYCEKMEYNGHRTKIQSKEQRSRQLFATPPCCKQRQQTQKNVVSITALTYVFMLNVQQV